MAIGHVAAFLKERNPEAFSKEANPKRCSSPDSTKTLEWRPKILVRFVWNLTLPRSSSTSASTPRRFEDRLTNSQPSREKLWFDALYFRTIACSASDRTPKSCGLNYRLGKEWDILSDFLKLCSILPGSQRPPWRVKHRGGKVKGTRIGKYTHINQVFAKISPIEHPWFHHFQKKLADIEVDADRHLESR